MQQRRSRPLQAPVNKLGLVLSCLIVFAGLHHLDSNRSLPILCSAAGRTKLQRLRCRTIGALRRQKAFRPRVRRIRPHEPFFFVLLSAMFLGEFPTIWVVSSLLPIVGGVALASMTEASFNWAGFWSAMASNLSNQSRNVLSKKVMVNKEESLDNITLFSIITMMSFVLLFLVTFFTEGIKFTPASLQAAAQQGLNVQQVLTRSFLAALFFHAYQQVSYMILQRVSLVTHSVGNCVKHVVVIVSSVLFFRTPVSPINSLGTGVALARVFLYSCVKRIKPKPKTA
ncbi:hypothetical protein ACJRO7_002813 [Eucalyptus globulus]|uniref:Sugar phosphate transporter domain-containing protein n=1 Tax=Eucalyptus globulus TaxID=34317 RepID=A0ABD3M173_EUCGL